MPTGSTVATPAPPPSTRHQPRPHGPATWIRRNLFNTWYNSVITIVLGAVILAVGYRLLRFVFTTGQWGAVSANLELFLIGLFPRTERWRLVAQLILLAGAIGAGAGSMRQAAKDRAEDSGERWTKTSPREFVGSYWSIIVFTLVTMAAFVRTTGPWLLLAAVLVAGVVAHRICILLPRRLRVWGWTLAAVLGVVELQVLSGTGGLAWVFTTLAVAPLLSSETGRLLQNRIGAALPLSMLGVLAGLAIVALRTDPIGLGFLALAVMALVNVLRGDRIDGGRIAAVVLGGLAMYAVYDSIGLEGVDWARWGGFHLNLVLTPIAIGLAFPLGLLLALGRRSKLPAIRVMSVAYIEFFRGAPLITFLLAAQFFLGFFLDADTPLSLQTRVIAAMTLFTSAYIAEIVRGGLQSVPSGQIEAGQAMGLSQAKVMRLIVLPQALRAVIPAMVGQFISLFKDTTLVSIVSINELLGARGLVHAQAAFRGQGIGETLVFVAFGFWAFAFTMSRESQRLERRLAVGDR